MNPLTAMDNNTLFNDMLAYRSRVQNVLNNACFENQHMLNNPCFETQKGRLQNLLKSVNSMLDALPFGKLVPSSIEVMYFKKKKKADDAESDDGRAKNGKLNNIREEIILCCANGLPVYFTQHPVYGSKWTDVQSKLNTVLKTHPRLKRLGGCKNNYDFCAEYIENDNVVHTQKLEFKHGAKALKDLTEILQLHTSFELIPGTSYIDLFYKTYLPQIIALFPEPVQIPPYEEYLRHVRSTTPRTHPYEFFKTLYTFRTNKAVSKQWTSIVRQSIREYLEAGGKSVNIKAFEDKCKVSQEGKLFLLWNLKDFYTEQFPEGVFDNLAFNRIQNGNVLVISNTIAEFHCLLRWKNGNGCCNPAWQIKYVPRAG